MKSTLFLLAFLFSVIVFAQEPQNSSATTQNGVIEIGDVIGNPGRFNNEFVHVQGLVTQYTPGTAQTTAYYLLKSNFGAIIKVNTSQDKPETNRKYEVSGTIVIDQVNMEAYLIESSKNCLDCKTLTQESWFGQYGKYIVIGGISLLLILIVVYLILRMQSNRNSLYSEPSPYTPSATPGPEGATIPIGRDDFKTIKISQSSPKTLKMIPGKLQIISGLDKGKEFPIMGFPGPDGSLLSIGREKGSGDAEYSHIQLLEKTVSRKQAEIIYRDKKLFVKNLSETNYTQLNGNELRVGESAEVVPNSTIKTGEVEFKYIL